LRVGPYLPSAPLETVQSGGAFKEFKRILECGEPTIKGDFVDRNQLQGQQLLNEGFVSREQVAHAYQVMAGHPSSDLCAFLVQKGVVDGQTAERIRHIVEVHINKNLIVPAQGVTLDIHSSLAIYGGASQSGALTTSPAMATNLESSRSRIEAGRQIGDYKIIRELNSGGMGAVYVAHSVKLGRNIALKTLLSGSLSSEVAIQRFMLEAQITAQLNHPNIVQVYDFGEEEGHHYLVMELIEGRSIKEFITEEGPLDTSKAVSWAIAVANALSYSHKRGILHRDIKPANILIRAEDEQALITDFGIARNDKSEGGGLTATGQMIGTPEYMAPEQVNGDQQFIDRRVDLYALGATLYEMLTGQPPFQGPTIANVITAILTKEPISPRKKRPELSSDLETICLKCLEKEASQRYLTAISLAADLQLYLDDQPIKARPPPINERFYRWRRRNKTALQIVLSIVVTAIVILGFFLGWPKLQEWRKGQLRREARLRCKKTLKIESERLKKSINKQLTIFNQDRKAKSLERDLVTLIKYLSSQQNITDELSKGISTEDREFNNKDLKTQLTEAIQSFPRKEYLARLYYLKSKLLAMKNKPEQADQARTEAYLTAPLSDSGAIAYSELGERRLTQEDFIRARFIFRQLTQSQSKTARSRAHLGLARIAIKKQDFDQASWLLSSSHLEGLDKERSASVDWYRSIANSLAGKFEYSYEDLKSPPLAHGRFHDGTPLLLVREGRRAFARVTMKIEGQAIQFIRHERFTLPKDIGRVKFIEVSRGKLLIILTALDSSLIYFYEWDNKSIRSNVHAPFPLKEWRKKWKSPYHALIGAGDVDGNGVPEILLWHGLKLIQPVLIWNANIDNQATPIMLRSMVGSVCFADLNGDGKDELVIGSREWSDFGVHIFGGSNFHEFTGKQDFYQVLGKCTGQIVLRSKGQADEVLMTTERQNQYDVLSVFGRDLSPGKPDALWDISYVNGQYKAKAMVRLPFESRNTSKLQSIMPLETILPSFPRSYAVGLQEKQPSPAVTRLCIVSRTNQPTVYIDFQHSRLVAINIDENPDKELIALTKNGVIAWGVQSQRQPFAGIENKSKLLPKKDNYAIAQDLILATHYRQARNLLVKELDEEALTPFQITSLHLSVARTYALERRFKDAIEQCLKINEIYGSKALELAAHYAEQSGDFKKAVFYIKRRLENYPQTASDRDNSHRELKRLSPLADLKSLVKIDGNSIKNSDWPVYVREPWLFQLKENSLLAKSTARTNPRCYIDVGRLEPQALRMIVKFRFKAFEFARDSRLILQNTGQKHFGICIELACHGGGDSRSYQRLARVKMLESGRKAEVDLKQFGNFHFYPDTQITLDVLYIHQTGTLKLGLSAGALKKNYEVSYPLSRLLPNKYRLKIGHNPHSFRQNTGTYNQIAWDSIELFLPHKKGKDPQEVDDIGLAGASFLRGDWDNAVKQLESFLARESVPEPQSLEPKHSLSGRFEATFLLATIYARQGQHRKACELFQSLRAKNEKDFDRAWQPRLFAFRSETRKALIATVNNNWQAARSWNDINNAVRANAAMATLRFLAHPQDLKMRFASGIALLRIGDFQASLNTLEGFFSSNSQSRIYAGQAAFRLRQYQRAYDIWQPVKSQLKGPLLEEFSLTAELLKKNN
jgi:serine/threonine protein kinase